MISNKKKITMLIDKRPSQSNVNVQNMRGYAGNFEYFACTCNKYLASLNFLQEHAGFLLNAENLCVNAD